MALNPRGLLRCGQRVRCSSKTRAFSSNTRAFSSATVRDSSNTRAFSSATVRGSSNTRAFSSATVRGSSNTRAFSSATDRKLYQTGISYMGGIRDFREVINMTRWKADKEISIAEAKEQGFLFNKPVRQYVNHHKHGRSHLLVNLEFEYLHCWARPPDGRAVEHPNTFTPHKPGKLAEFVPNMVEQCEYEDDWLLTDFQTLYHTTAAFVPRAYSQFLGTTFHAEGTEEYQALLEKHIEMFGGENAELDLDNYPKQPVRVPKHLKTSDSTTAEETAETAIDSNKAE